MKKLPGLYSILGILYCCLFHVQLSKAQILTSYYSFSALSGTYTPLTGGTAATTMLADDATKTSIPIGFTFSFCGTGYTQLSACSNGFISLANSSSTALTNSAANIASAGWLMPYWDDGYGSTTGAAASYKTTGTAPNRVFTMEWYNWGFCCSSTALLSYQVRLYEGTNVIEFQYSPISSSSRSASIGIANSTTDYKVLDGAGTAPNASSTTFTTTIAAQPANGQIYRFTPPVISCPAPTNVAVSSITTTSASVSFTGTSGSYIVEYGAPGFTPGTGTTAGTGGTIVTGSASPITLSGLSSMTNYDVYVRGNCSAANNGISFNTTVTNFTTLCQAPSVVTTTPGTRCGTGTVTLSATASSGTLKWYSAATGGTQLGTGTTFTTPSISATTNYYVAASSGTQGNLGKTIPVSTSGNTGYSDIGLVFNALVPFTLQSVDVYPLGSTTTGSITIALKNSSGTVLQSATATLTATTPATVNVIPLNFSVPAGTGMRLVVTAASGITSLIRESSTSNFSYPYTLSGVASITSAYTGGASSSYYYYLYNWSVLSGCESARTAVAATITNTPPQATATPAGATTVCLGNNVVINANTGAGLSYQWKQSGVDIPGATGSSYTASNAGSYTVAISAGIGCTGTSPAVNVAVNPLPTTTISANGPTVFCVGGNVVLSVPSAANQTYQWYNGTAAIGGATSNTYTATVTGNYGVTVTNTATGCTASSTSSVNVTAGSGPPAVVSPAGTTSICPGDSALLAANSLTGATYQWQLNGVDINGATNNNYKAPAVGNYTVSVSTGPGCNTTSAATTVMMYPVPVVTTTPSGTVSICQNNTITLSAPAAAGQSYQWKQGATVLAGITGNTYTTGTAGAYSCTVTNATGCKATSAIVSVVVNPLPPATLSLASTSATVCEDDTVWMNANAGLNYQWLRNGTVIPGANTSQYGTTIGGIYSLKTTDNNGCTNTSSSLAVTVNARPHSMISHTTPLRFCAGGSVVLNAVSATGTNYQWYDNGSPIPGATDNYYITSQNGSHTVKITNGFGCTDISNPPAVVTVDPLPSPVVTKSHDTLATGNYDSYQWYLNGQPITGATNHIYKFSQDGSYTVRVTDANGCTNYAPLIGSQLGIAPVNGETAIKIYPNPASTVVYVDVPVPVTIAVLGLDGRMLLQEQNARQVNIDALADGVYLIKVYDKNSVPIHVEKFVKTSR